MRNSTRPGSDRDRQLRQILESERDRTLNAVRVTIREGREEGAIENHEVQDEAERSEADAQSELEFTLLEMRGATLDRIAEALDRLDEGRYGFCADCERTIAVERLKALPFATRCRGCEQQREADIRDHTPAPTWDSAAGLLRMGMLHGGASHDSRH